jgi:hypothetical protein
MPFAIMAPSWEATTDKVLMIMSRIQSTKFPSDLDRVMAMKVAIDMAQTVQVMWTRDKHWLARTLLRAKRASRMHKKVVSATMKDTIKMHNQAVQSRIKVALRAKVDVKKAKKIIGMPRN